MSWLYSQALAAEYSAANCSAGEQSAPSSGTTTPDVFSSLDRTTDALPRSLYGTTLALSTDDLGEGLLTWFLEGFHARMLVSSIPMEPGSMGCVQDYGRKWGESFARWARDSCSWKTRQLSLIEGLDEFSETWPRWGMMHDGECWAQSMPAHLTRENGFGFSVPTPLKSDAMRLSQFKKESLLKGTYGANVNCVPYWTAAQHGKVASEELTAWLMGWPTGWALSNASATDRFRQWLHSHGIHSAHDKTP
jgi:hypothetical protein